MSKLAVLAFKSSHKNISWFCASFSISAVYIYIYDEISGEKYMQAIYVPYDMYDASYTGDRHNPSLSGKHGFAGSFIRCEDAVPV